MKKFFTLIAAALVAATVNAGEIFKLTVTATETVSVESGADVALDDYATWTDQDLVSVSIHNGHGSKAANMITANGLSISNSGGSYIYISDLKTKLKEGDVITVDGGKECLINLSTSSSATNNTVNGSFICTKDFDGQNGFYICRGAGKPTAIMNITIERNENQVISPSFSVVGNTVVMTTGTEGATIYYGTASGACTTEYTAPVTFNETTTFYAVAKKEGMEDSKEASKTVEYYAIPANATLGTTLGAPEIIAAGGSDVELESLSSDGYTATKKESDAVLSNSATYAVVEGSPVAAYEGLVKVKKTIVITAPDNVLISGIKVIGIANANGSVQPVTATGMNYTTDNNNLPARDNADQQPGTVELVAATPANSFEVYFSGQARAKFEVYVGGTADAIKNVNATSKKTVKALRNGQLVIETANGTFTAAGARLN